MLHRLGMPVSEYVEVMCAIGNHEEEYGEAVSYLAAALIIGEDPMQDDKLGSYFGNVEFLAALVWGPTETTQFADVVFPGSTFLESEGTRVNFEGRLTRYTQAVKPPFGVPTWEILAGLAKAFGIERAFCQASCRIPPWTKPRWPPSAGFRASRPWPSRVSVGPSRRVEA